jgi:transposase
MSPTASQPQQDEQALHPLLQENAELKAQVQELTRQLEWFKRQLFGPKSERRLTDEASHTPDLFGRSVPPLPESACEEIAYKRRKPGVKDRAGAVTEEGLRFDETVPVEIVEVTAPQLCGDAEQWEIISYKETHRLAQRPGSYVVIKYRHPVLRHKSEGTLTSTPAPANVLEGSLADVSFLAGMLVDKFCYHQPLYRQHGRQWHPTQPRDLDQAYPSRDRAAEPDRRSPAPTHSAESRAGDGRDGDQGRAQQAKAAHESRLVLADLRRCR